MSMDISNVQVGWDVYGSDGEKVGDVSDVGSNYLLVTKGFLFTKDIYIPPSAVRGPSERLRRQSDVQGALRDLPVYGLPDLPAWHLPGNRAGQ